MKWRFEDRDMVHKLRNACQWWVDTPWRENSCVPGLRGGVSCHHLPAAIYQEIGVVPAFAVPTGQANYWRTHSTSLIEPWMDTQMAAWFEPVKDLPMIGDALGFRLGKCLHHLGICLGDDRFVHCYPGLSVHVNELTDPTWMSRLARVWRPVERSTDDARR